MSNRNNPPPIQWMPVFVTAARQRSFKKAADLLHVSPSAVSQQIKALEAFLEIPLFKRNGPRVELTEAGEVYFHSAEKTIAQHLGGFEELNRRFKKQSLRLNAPLFIAQEILIPDYLGFKERQPQTELRITTGTEYIDFEADIADVAVRFGAGQWPGLIAEQLCAVKVSPVCATKRLRSDWRELDITEIINAQTLISTTEDQSEWFQLFPDITPGNVIVCDSYFSAMKSVEKGLGLGLGLIPAINNWLNDQRLSLIKPAIYNTESAYWLVYPERHRNNELIDICYQWARSVFATLPPIQSAEE